LKETNLAKQEASLRIALKFEGTILLYPE
jgi:hypothetical protein